jgi:O-antigen ligase
MVSIVKPAKLHALPLLTLICLGISIYGNEWQYAISTPLLFSYLVKFGPWLGFFILSVAFGTYSLRGFPDNLRFWLYFWLAVYVSILVGGVLSWFDTPATPWVFIGLVQAIFCGFIGYRIGNAPEAAAWTLRMIARSAMCVSLYMFVTPEPLEGTSFPNIGVGWPVRLFILFGFCWYLSAALSVPHLTKEVVFGGLACSLEVFVAFHKPIVFAGLGCIATMALMQQIIPQTRMRGNTRLVGGIALSMVVLFAAVQFSGGSILEGYREEFFTKYLHMKASGGAVGLDEKTLERFSGGRFELWAQAIDLFWKSPWVGSGPGQRFYGPGEEVHAHDGYIELLYSVGVIGALAHIAAAWIWFQQTIIARGLARRARLILPIAVFVGGFLAFEMGGGAAVLYTVLSFVYLLMGIGLGYSVALRPAVQPWVRQRQRVTLRARS